MFILYNNVYKFKEIINKKFKIIKKVRDERYKDDNPSKIIIILQNMDGKEIYKIESRFARRGAGART